MKSGVSGSDSDDNVNKGLGIRVSIKEVAGHRPKRTFNGMLDQTLVGIEAV